ncbi:FAD-binding oxidoreductase [Pseudoruegeria sp. HB172150]|uniref:FAD-binding oxidoreductase n=1 Tax=Pseudoruegeria sp. HB172150 TaxID=2721164 RepID=UPI001556A42C|nr:FAD-binding oxidoreductase [Pseudoruegeria sp. HB172150]
MLNPVTDAFAESLRVLLPAAAFKDDTARYTENPRGGPHGIAGLIVAPGSTEEVATVIREAGKAQVGVIPFGGGTGLVTGQIMLDGPAPLILSLERMAKIRGVYPQENVLVAEGGAILADIQSAAEEAGRLFPLSLGSEGSARIGGLLGTNAGGLNVLRYGNARELCLGLEAVLPDGSIWHGLKRLRKDNTGYDLKDLLVGAEGTLGVITAAALRLFPRPTADGTAVLAVPDPEAALGLLALARDIAGDSISGFELISKTGPEFLTEVMPEVRQPFAEPPDWMVLIELGLFAGQDPAELLETIFTQAFEKGYVTDGLIAQSEGQRAEFWRMREAIPEANRTIGAISSHDISIPLGRIPEFIERGPGVLAEVGEYRINCFGHLGDGNLHYNCFPPKGVNRDDRISEKAPVQRAVHDLVHEMDGSISAEHGIGRLKAADLERYGDPAKLAAMRAIKRALDPVGIMNPGAVLREE